MHVRMNGLGHQDAAEALGACRVVGREEVKFIHPFHIEDDTSLAAIDFKRVVILTSGRKPCSFESAQRSILEPRQHEGRILNSHRSVRIHFCRLPSLERATAAFVRQRPFIDKLRGHSGDFCNVAHEVPRQVNQMRIKIGVSARARRFLAQVPSQRELRVHDPALKVRRTPVEQSSQSTFL